MKPNIGSSKEITCGDRSAAAIRDLLARGGAAAAEDDYAAAIDAWSRILLIDPEHDWIEIVYNTAKPPRHPDQAPEEPDPPPEPPFPAADYKIALYTVGGVERNTNAVSELSQNARPTGKRNGNEPADTCLVCSTSAVVVGVVDAHHLVVGLLVLVVPGVRLLALGQVAQGLADEGLVEEVRALRRLPRPLSRAPREGSSVSVGSLPCPMPTTPWNLSSTRRPWASITASTTQPM